VKNSNNESWLFLALAPQSLDKTKAEDAFIACRRPKALNSKPVHAKPCKSYQLFPMRTLSLTALGASFMLLPILAAGERATGVVEERCGLIR